MNKEEKEKLNDILFDLFYSADVKDLKINKEECRLLFMYIMKLERIEKCYKKIKLFIDENDSNER